MFLIAGMPLLARDDDVPVVAQAAAIRAAAPIERDGSKARAVCNRGRRRGDTDSMSDSSLGGTGGAALLLLGFDAECEGDEQLFHAGDLGGLIDVDVGRKLEDGLVLTGAVSIE